MSTDEIARPASRFSNLKTKPKVLMAAAVPLVMALLIGTLALVNLSRIHDTQGWVDHTQRVLSEASDIVAAAVDMETGLRGYLLAGQEQSGTLRRRQRQGFRRA